MDDKETKEIRVTCVWRTTQTVVVPKGYKFGKLDEVWADQVDSGAAELVDWWEG